MAGRLRFEVAQPITIIGFALAACLLIGILVAASRQSFVATQEGHALTQAFYYAVWAAGIYVIIAAIMLLTVAGALLGKYERKFNLTPDQRTLMLQTISFMAYLLIGALIFSTIEGWRYLDAVYFADFTLLTVGIGSPLTPQTHTGRSLLIPFAVGGFVTLGLIINSVRSMLLETGKSKIRARTTEKTRSRVHSYVDVKNMRPGILPNSNKFREPVGMSIGDRRRHEFHAMRQIQKRAISKSKWMSLFGSAFAGCVLWFVGALVFQHTEYKQGWSYFVSLYFSYTSLLTIGYGDFQPLSNCGRAFFVFWSLLAVPTLTVLISDMGDTIVQWIEDGTNWIGTLTILPSDTGFASTWKKIVGDLARFLNPSVDRKNIHLKGPTQEAKEQGVQERQDFVSILKRRLGDDGAAHSSSLAESSALSKKHRNHAFFQWLLVKEVRAVLADTQAKPAKEYCYDEWKYFLRLLGHDEHKPELHRRPNPTPIREPDEEPRIGRPIDHHGIIRPWSWMGIRSPLMSPKDEADWVLQQLLSKLHRHMEQLATDVEEEELPVSLDILLLSEKDSSDSGSSKRPISGNV